MARDGTARRRCAPKRRAGRRREDPSTYPDFGELSPEALLAHRELQYIRNPTAARLTKLQEAQRAMAG